MGKQFDNMGNRIIRTFLTMMVATGWFVSGYGQKPSVHFESDASNPKRLVIKSDDDSLALFWYDDTLRRPYLHQFFAPGQHLITRGYPLLTRPGDTTDHPHQVGVWLTYEDVNGSDFWNNSPWPAADRKAHLGSIVIDSITEIKNGNPAILSYTARWKDKHGIVVLKEETSYRFSDEMKMRIIDRTTTLTATEPVTIGDVKDGVFGIRLRRELQVPTNGSVHGENGNYLSSEGFTGNDVWGKPAKWVMLSGKLGDDVVSILVADHPKNPGYPAYWHARGYGLFALNSFAQKAFQPALPAKQLVLPVSQSVTLQYRLAVAAGRNALNKEDAGMLANDFGKNR